MSRTGTGASRGEHGTGIEDIEVYSGVVAVMASLRDLADTSEYDVETAAVASAVAKRRREFFAGRNLARVAIARLGVAAMAIPRNADRSPRWPPGIRGSISHTDEHVMVAVTDSPGIQGIGIDVETENSVDEELRSLIRADE